jgi:hypothetical protein
MISKKALFGNEIHPKLVSVGKIAVPSISVLRKKFCVLIIITPLSV